MPAYKYQMKNGKTKWYANFYYTDWLGQKQHNASGDSIPSEKLRNGSETFLTRPVKIQRSHFLPSVRNISLR